MLEKIVDLFKGADTYLQAKTQVFMDWQQAITGLNKFMFEKWSVLFGMFFFGTFAFGEGTLTLELFALVCFAWVIALIHTIEQQEANFLSNDSLDIPTLMLKQEQFKQWLRQQEQSTRYHFVIIGGVILLTAFFVADPMRLLFVLGFIVCSIAAQYFVSCIPRH